MHCFVFVFLSPTCTSLFLYFVPLNLVPHCGIITQALPQSASSREGAKTGIKGAALWGYQVCVGLTQNSQPLSPDLASILLTARA